jgi:DNA-binding response OmpR family regulator
MQKIMIVDDEVEIAEMIEDFMSIEDMQIVKASSGTQALELFDDSIDLVVLDVNMDDMTGTEVCKIIRKKSFVPIIFLTCNNTQSDMMRGLSVGADDFVTKPFDPMELSMRIKANIRRFKSYTKLEPSEEVLRCGDLAVYSKKFKVYKNEVDLEMPVIQFKLLHYMMENAYIVLTRNQILNEVWGNAYYDENLVNTTIKRLRKKIEDVPEKPLYIKTVRGVGYVFEGTPRQGIKG